MEKKTLIFEGAGWDMAENNGVGNCRIRTRIRNNDGRLIYLEMGGIKYTGNLIPEWAKGLEFCGRVDYCFYSDSKWDSRMNYSAGLSPVKRKHFEYNKESILEFVNENLNCSFDNLEVINDSSVRVHDTKEPLCDCSQEGYTPFKEIEYNISELEGTEPFGRFANSNVSHYRISWDFVKELPSLKKWMEEKTDQEKQKFPNNTYYSVLRWDNTGTITSLEITATQSNFVNMSFGSEELESVIAAIKDYDRELTA